MADAGFSDRAVNEAAPPSSRFMAVSAEHPTPPFTSCSRAFVTEFDFLRRALLRHGVAAADVDDAVQDVFLTMWRRWAEYDTSRPLRPWLAGIAFHRAQHRRPQREIAVDDLETRDETPGPEEHLLASRARALLLSAIATLPEKHREPLVMHDLDGLSITEVARQMRVSAATASARVHAARRACAKALRRRETVDSFRATRAALGLLWSLPAPRHPPRTGAPLAFGAGLLVAAATVTGALVATRGRSREETRPVMEAAVHVQPSWGGAWRRAPVMPPPGSPRTEALSSGLIGDWRFDEERGSAMALDRSTSANDCAVHGLGPAARVPGRHGGALHVGAQGWLECPRTDAIAALDHEMTVAAWIRPVSLWGAQTIAARQEDRGRPDQFFFGIVNGQLDVHSRVWRRRLAAPLPAGHDWIHVAFTRRSDGVVTLFVNGARAAESKGRARFSLGGGRGPLTIGGGINGRDRARADELFGGDLDDLLIYDRALGGTELASLAGGARPE